MNAQLGDAIAYRLNVSHQTELTAFDPGYDHTSYGLILEVIDPGGKFWQWPDRKHKPSVIERLQILSAHYAHDALSAMAQDNSGYGYFWWRPWHNVEMPNGLERVYIAAAQGNGVQKVLFCQNRILWRFSPLALTTQVDLLLIG